MKKRTIVFGKYDTALYGWTLAALQLTDPEYQAHFQEVVGRDGPLDFSTVLSDGEPRYGSRTLTATLETSEGTRAERRARISKIINTLDGLRWDIRHPDHPAHYLSGRVQVKEDYNDLAHASVTVTAICDPWLYALTERVCEFPYTLEETLVTLVNKGRRVLVPKIVVNAGGENSFFFLHYDGTTQALNPGTYTLPYLLLKPGETVIGYSSVNGCTAQISYREAVLR